MGSGSEFFICFTARPSSSSSSCAAVMRVPSSKSLMSPGRARDSATPSLSASLSRRLRNSRSVKGAQSPMFPAAMAAGGRRKGCAFEAAEPSSPKVTCIGQVRVKSKKKHRGKAKASGLLLRSRSQRSGGSGGEVSFRRTAAEQEKRGRGERKVGGKRECLPAYKNQGWVQQLPFTICEAFRALGSEFNCFVPCGKGKSFCSSSSTREEEEKGRGAVSGEKRTKSSNSCGAVFARWLMAIQESEDGKRREVVGLVVEERERKNVGMFVGEKEKGAVEELGVVEVGRGEVAEKKEEAVMEEEEEEEEEEGEGEGEGEARVSVCIPPKNALLLMRCRSDPVRMASLSSRFWDSPAVRTEVVEEHNADEEEEENGEENIALVGGKEGDGEDIERHAAKIFAVTGKPEAMIAEDRESPESLNTASALEGEGEPLVDKAEGVMWDHGPENKRKEGREEEVPTEESSAVSAEVLRSSSKKAEEAEAAEETQVEANAKEKQAEVKDEIKLRDSEEEKEDGETKWRPSSSCSSTRQEMHSRSDSCFSKAKEAAIRRSLSSREKKRRHSFSSEKEARRHGFLTEREARKASFSIDMEGRRRWSFSIDKEDVQPEDETIVGAAVEVLSTEAEKKTVERSREKARETVIEPEKLKSRVEKAQIVAVRGSEREAEREEKKELPDCLLLMMYEPKLSMEVSKETWVCSRDYLRWRPYQQHHHQEIQPPNSKPKDDDHSEKQCNSDSRGVVATHGSTHQPSHPPPLPPPPPPPPAPAPPSATIVKLKLLEAAAVAPPPKPPQPYGPFVLTRCKSEPMSSSARLVPDACFWKSRNQPIGAIGF